MDLTCFASGVQAGKRRSLIETKHRLNRMDLIPMESRPSWLEVSEAGVVLKLRVQPGAKHAKVIGPHGDQLKVAVAAPPVDGKANEALLVWLSKILGVKRANLSIVSGQSSRDKRVRLLGEQPEWVIRRLAGH